MTEFDALNLQTLCIQAKYGSPTPLSDYSCKASGGRVDVYFRDLEAHLITHIQRADVVLGCVAWVTSEPILNALACKEGVSLIVQKEDFLRPDSAERTNWSRRLRRLYGSLPDMSRYELPFLSGMSCCSDPTLDAVRCVGNYNAEKSPAFPRSHHKFVLFCQYDQQIEPYAVWTGSFNFTKTAGASFENAVVVHNPHIVNAFYQEYLQIAALSEPLDWESEWSAPEWRIGS